MSTDKEFAPKAAEVVAFYLNPPVKAVVLSVDEKPSIQAIERASSYVEQMDRCGKTASAYRQFTVLKQTMGGVVNGGERAPG